MRVGMAAGASLECPECGCVCAGYDLREERRWRHLDKLQFPDPFGGAGAARLLPAARRPEREGAVERAPLALHPCLCLVCHTCFASDQSARAGGDVAALECGASPRPDAPRGGAGVDKARRQPMLQAMPHLGIDEKSIARGHTYLTYLTYLTASATPGMGMSLKSKKGAPARRRCGFWRAWPQSKKRR